jgi:hypothetical protein
MQSGAKRTFVLGSVGSVPSFNKLYKVLRTCFNEKISSGPSFGLPRWLINTTLPPSANIFFMVGMAARIRVSSVTACVALSKGTLKSTRIKAVLPLKLNEENLLIVLKIMLPNKKPELVSGF